MKKVLLSVAVIAALASFSSCSKCGACEVGGVTGGEICQKDSKTAYDLAKDVCEAGGGDWVTK